MKRIPEIDALRGIALYGILLVNIFLFHAPPSYYAEFYGAFEGLQLTTVDMVVYYAGGKFLFIFAFLFGYGALMQQSSHLGNFPKLFRKRMSVLLVFGALHVLLFWFGDILTSYALLGFLLIPFLKLSNRSLLGLSLLFILFRPLYFFAVVLLGVPEIAPAPPGDLQYFLTIFQEGNYWEIFNLRMAEFMVFTGESIVWYIPKTFGLFLAGVYAARKNIFQSFRDNSANYFKVTLALILVSTIWTYFKPTLFSMFDLEAQPIWRPILIFWNVIFETTLGAGYIIGFTLLLQRSYFLTEILSKPGRMALTNYIIQSTICVLIFYGYGLGYYGRLRPTDLVLISVVIFAVNTAFSFIYLHYRKQGPLEWLWRWLITKIR